MGPLAARDWFGFHLNFLSPRPRATHGTTSSRGSRVRRGQLGNFGTEASSWQWGGEYTATVQTRAPLVPLPLLYGNATSLSKRTAPVAVRDANLSCPLGRSITSPAQEQQQQQFPKKRPVLVVISSTSTNEWPEVAGKSTTTRERAGRRVRIMRRVSVVVEVGVVVARHPTKMGRPQPR